MQTKTIDKLRELDDFIWGEEKENILESIYCEDIDGTELQFKRNIKNIDGNYEIVNMFEVSEKNLDELEFYGLKVIVNEKANLTREEREYLSAEWYIARDDDGKLFFYHMYPKRNEEYKEWEPNVESRACALDINRTLFPFITWESGKAWSKAELMELEVVE